MFKKFRELIKKKYIGVDLFNGRITVFELNGDTFINKSIDCVCKNVLAGENNKNFWYNTNCLEEIFTYIQQNIERSVSIPKLCIAIPADLYKNSEDTKRIMDAAFKSKWINLFMVNNFVCSAIGAGINAKEFRRKIYIYSLENLTYIGLIFGGNNFNLKVLEKGYNELTEIDIKNNIEELIDEVSTTELPEHYKKSKLNNNDLEKLVLGWNLEIERKIYISVPSELNQKLGIKIGEFELVYSDSKDSIIEGLRYTMTTIK